MTLSVCVYCASSPHCDPDYFTKTAELARRIVDRGWRIVYGAGSTGLMGQLADSALAHGGSVTGVIPQFMREREWDHPYITETIVTRDMHERKQRMIDLGDAFVALPGGTGTFEEIIELISFKRLELVHNPAIIANWKGYYEPLIEQLERTITGRFLDTRHRGIWSVADSVDAIIEQLDAVPVDDERRGNRER